MLRTVKEKCNVGEFQQRDEDARRQSTRLITVLAAQLYYCYRLRGGKSWCFLANVERS